MYETHTLENGLRILIKPLENQESVSLGIWVKVGGRFESKRLTGISHFIEHMLFKGTKRRTTRQIKEEIEGVGGMLNAFTSEESTCYMAKVLQRDAENALDVLADMVKDASLKTSDIEKERTVILEEIKMYYDLPMHYVHEIFTDLLWPGQSLGNYIAGTPESVQKLTPAMLRVFKQKYYHPKNIAVTVFGNVNSAEIREQVINLFSPLKGKPVSRFTPARKSQRALRMETVEKAIEQTNFVLGVHGISRNDKDRYKAAVLNIILGGNMSSRLFEQVREQRGLAYSIRSHFSTYEDTGSFSISAGVDDRKTLQALRVILRELERISEKHVSSAELKRAKDYYLGQLLLGLEDSLEHLLWVGERYLYSNDTPELERIREEINAVTAEDIRDMARKLFQKQRWNFALIGPTKPPVIERIRKALDK